jgi:PAS domain S-box-containing protein
MSRRVIGLGADEYIARSRLNAQYLVLTLSKAAQRKQLEVAALRMEMVDSMQSPFETIMASAPVGLAYFDRELQIRQVNDNYAQIWQGTSATSLNRSLYSVAPHIVSHAEAHRKALAGKAQSFQNWEIVDPLKGSRRYFDIHYVPARNERGENAGVVSAAIDVTEPQELDKLRAELLRYASHELKTPLTNLHGVTNLAMRKALVMEAPELIASLGAIEEHLDQMNHLARSLLDLSRIEHGFLKVEMSNFDMADVIRSVARRYQMNWPAFKFTLTLPDCRARVCADESLIEQVMINLLDNGIKYSSGTRCIDISLRLVDNEILTSVRDYGIGILPTQSDRIFQRFFRASNAVQRAETVLGAGLYIAHDIINRHGGRIWLEHDRSTWGQMAGCDFRFVLPAAQQQENETAPVSVRH